MWHCVCASTVSLNNDDDDDGGGGGDGGVDSDGNNAGAIQYSEKVWRIWRIVHDSPN